ncbi:Lrp/AsnC family transcriptional regulator [Candidatus Woesearchaeota archaeon]|nr:Lrp/AsnC family transcriptional regulator [Candidatus Woesearchaeota archaeon]
MDKTDWKILVLLGKNSRTTVVEMASEVKLSADAVAERIRKLEKSGVIRHYNIVPNESKYPYLHYKVLVGFRNISEERERSLREYCRTNPDIVYIVKSLGPWEFEIDMEVESAEKFREVMMDIKTAFNDLLKDYSALHIYQVHKYNFCPSIQIPTP